jgi:CspA family cold shock protein
MSTGQITRLMKDRGFGFIKPSTSSEDVFFHATSLNAVTFDELREGENVEFDLEQDPRNPSRTRAANVRRVA